MAGGKGRASAVVALVVVVVVVVVEVVVLALVLALVVLALHPRGQPMAPNNPFHWTLLPPQV